MVDKPQDSRFSASYQTFGLIIDSEIVLPQLLPSNSSPSLRIRLGAVPEKLESITVEGPYYQLNASEFLLTIENTARYFIKNGEEIIVEVANGADERLLQLFLLSAALTVVLHQRGILVLHGSALAFGDKAILIVGASQAGKSTTSAALMQRGFRLMADDMAVIDFDEQNNPIVYSGIPQQNLWRDTLDYFDKSADGLEEITFKLNKFALPVKESFWADRLPIHRIYILELTEESLSLEAILGLGGLHSLAANIFREQFINPENAPAMMQQLAKIAHTVPLRRISRPKDVASHEALVALIEADLEN